MLSEIQTVVSEATKIGPRPALQDCGSDFRYSVPTSGKGAERKGGRNGTGGYGGGLPHSAISGTGGYGIHRQFRNQFRYSS